MRLTTKAFTAASPAVRRSNQWPISKNEQRPTPSQPRKSTSRLFPITRKSIMVMKRLR
jgi:hypothetical protein